MPKNVLKGMFQSHFQFMVAICGVPLRFVYSNPTLFPFIHESIQKMLPFPLEILNERSPFAANICSISCPHQNFFSRNFFRETPPPSSRGKYLN